MKIVLVADKAKLLLFYNIVRKKWLKVLIGKFYALAMN